MSELDAGITEDRLLDGRVILRQPRDGFRAGIDSVLLAAAVPATSRRRGGPLGRRTAPRTASTS